MGASCRLANGQVPAHFSTRVPRCLGNVPMVSWEMLEGIIGESEVRVKAGRKGRVCRSLRVRLGQGGMGM